MGGGFFSLQFWLVMKRKIQFSFAFLHQKAWWKWYQWRKMKWKNGTPLDSFFVFFSGCLGLVSSEIVYEWNEKKNIFGLEKKKKKSEKNFNTPVAITFSKTKRNGMKKFTLENWKIERILRFVNSFIIIHLSVNLIDLDSIEFQLFSPFFLAFFPIDWLIFK